MSILKSIAAIAVLFGAAASADAQAYVVYSPVVAAPAPVVIAPAAPTVVYRPVVPYTVASPVVVAPAPAVVAPAVQPVVRTRYRPILGGTVSRLRYRYSPVVLTPLY